MAAPIKEHLPPLLIKLGNSPHQTIVQVLLLSSHRSGLQIIQQLRGSKGLVEAQVHLLYVGDHLQALFVLGRQIDLEEELREIGHEAASLNSVNHPKAIHPKDRAECYLHLLPDNSLQEIPISAGKEVTVEVHADLHPPHPIDVNLLEALPPRETKEALALLGNVDQEVQFLPEAQTISEEEAL